MERSYRGGHSASERLVAQIYERSITNLVAALEFPESGFEVVKIYDNSVLGSQVRQILTFRQGRLQSVARNLPAWMKTLLEGSKFDPK
jgi:predicted ABC-type ATPase